MVVPPLTASGREADMPSQWKRFDALTEREWRTIAVLDISGVDQLMDEIGR